MSEYVKELQMHIRDREYKIEKLKEENHKLKEALQVAIVATLGTEMKKTTTELQQAGATTGGVWAGGFMVSVNALPGSVYATLAAMVAPDVARILGQQGQRSGKPPE